MTCATRGPPSRKFRSRPTSKGQPVRCPLNLGNLRTLECPDRVDQHQAASPHPNGLRVQVHRQPHRAVPARPRRLLPAATRSSGCCVIHPRIRQESQFVNGRRAVEMAALSGFGRHSRIWAIPLSLVGPADLLRLDRIFENRQPLDPAAAPCPETKAERDEGYPNEYVWRYICRDDAPTMYLSLILRVVAPGERSESAAWASATLRDRNLLPAARSSPASALEPVHPLGGTGRLGSPIDLDQTVDEP